MVMNGMTRESPAGCRPNEYRRDHPDLDISEVEAGSLGLRFNSSWRPEACCRQDSVQASFDGGAFQDVLIFSSEAGDNYKDSCP